MLSSPTLVFIYFSGLTENMASVPMILIPCILGVVQMVPLVPLYRSGYEHCKLMDDASHAREAELIPRRLFNFISPIQLFIAVLLFITCCLIILIGSGFAFNTYTTITLGSLVFSNTAFTVSTFIVLYSKKTNPHMAAQDRNKNIRSVAQSNVLTSMAASLLIMAISGTTYFDVYKT